MNVVGIVPMAHVAELPRTIGYYERLGFRVDGRWEHEGKLVWAALVCGRPGEGVSRLYISQASDPIDAHQQAVLFYLYSDDLAALRNKLIGAGVAVSEITYPEYMKKGEMRLVDPDGYVLLVGQTD